MASTACHRCDVSSELFGFATRYTLRRSAANIMQIGFFFTLIFLDYYQSIVHGETPYFCRHAEVLAALQPYTHWMAQLYSEAQQAGHSQAQLSQLLDGYIDVIIPFLSKQVNGKNSH